MTLGRQYDAMVAYLPPLAAAGAAKGGVFFGHLYDNDNLQNTMRINNAVKYASPDDNGWRFGSRYGFSDAAGGFSNNRAYSFGTSYNDGPFRIAASYLQLNNAGAAANLAGATDSIVNPAGHVTGSGSTFSAGQQRAFGTGFDYVFGPAMVGFVFTQTILEDATGINNTSSSLMPLSNSSLRFNNYEVNGIYAVTLALTVTG